MPTRKPRYSVHPGVAMVQKWIGALERKSGRSLEQWMKFIQKNGPKSVSERRAWLKNEHGIGGNTAAWMAQRSVGETLTWDESPEAYLQQAEVYVQEMFAGKKTALKPIYDELLEMGLALAKDVKACPCQTIVPLYRNHVFAQIKPAANSRIDMGFALKDTKPTGPLIDTGGFAKKDRITHRIPITSIEAIDGEVEHWLRVAYEMDG